VFFFGTFFLSCLTNCFEQNGEIAGVRGFSIPEMVPKDIINAVIESEDRVDVMCVYMIVCLISLISICEASQS
jgi:hypothetical protein